MDATSGTWSVEGTTLKGLPDGTSPGIAVRLDDERPGRTLPPGKWSTCNAQTVVVATPAAGWGISRPGWGLVACHSAPAGSPSLWDGYLARVRPLDAPSGYNTHTMSIWKVAGGVPAQLGASMIWGLASGYKSDIILGLTSGLVGDIIYTAITLSVFDQSVPRVNLHSRATHYINTRPCENPTSQRFTDIDFFDTGIASILRHDFTSLPGRFRGVPGVAALPGTDGIVLDRVRLVQGTMYGDLEAGAALRPIGDGLTYDPGSGYYQPDSRLGGVLLPI